ncbi:MAG: FAD-dependent pyridine nucleotide-disulfide oxidoreductase [Rhodospirillales bacterium]|nr:FAD-dependent pyridine nucleotide-disulfide oxidoreductase [Rhodospirillales bacterium]
MAGSQVTAHPDIAAARLSPEVYRANFADVHPPLEADQAVVEANRCYFCYDAPCVEACPTGIDIPGFIRKIATGNVDGAGLRILEENIFGGSCARVCPTEILCEAACVRTEQQGKPIAIGALQRYATDPTLAAAVHPFTRALSTGRRVAVVGGGPAGLACAHRLAMLGHDVTVFEARERLGGLNEYGIAEYKVADHFARAEVDFVLAVGGIAVRTGVALGRDLSLADLRGDYDAVFLGMGLAGVKALECEGEELQGVFNAVDYIERLRQAADFATLPIGRRIVVIGGGNTAIDIAVQAKRLGAEDVTLVYRRTAEAMSATGHEQEFAQTNGVRIKHSAQPVRLTGRDGGVAEAVFEYTATQGGRLVGTGEIFALPADMVFKAIGQVFVADPLAEGGSSLLALANGRIRVDADGKTSLDKVWAGGDCIAGGQDLTVQAVEDGKRAALAIHRSLAG